MCVLCITHESRLQTKQKVWQLLVLLGWSLPLLSALGLTWYRNSQDMMETQYLDTCQMPEYTRLMFTNNGAHVTARNAMYFCSFWILWLWLYFFLWRFPSWWLFEKVCILCLKCEVIEVVNADKKSKSNAHWIIEYYERKHLPFTIIHTIIELWNHDFRQLFTQQSLKPGSRSRTEVLAEYLTDKKLRKCRLIIPNI